MKMLLLIPLITALMLPSCSPCKKPCPKRYGAPSAPTRPICPEARPKCGCKGKAHPHRTGLNRHPISLSQVTDFLPSIPPGYTSI